MEELQSDNLKDVLSQHKLVLVQYGAAWCGICRLMKPKLKKLSEDNPSIHFIYADAEQFPGSREHAEVQNLPTFAGFVNGALVKQCMGSKIENVQEIVDEIASH
jgi:thiol-disulfide isomerase/thioredoxin